MKHFAFILLASTALGACSMDGASTKAQLGENGFDTAGMDKNVAAGDDFYEFANGTWAKETAIPSDKSNYGMFTAISDLSDERTRAILDEVKGDADSKVGRAFASFLDEEAVDKAGLEPLKPWLDQIKAITDHSEYAKVLGEANKLSVSGPVGGYINQDDKNPTVYALNLYQDGLGMPDRDYYLSDDKKLAETRAKYEAHIVKMLELAGESDAAARAKALVEFETGIAKVHWTQVENRDADKTYNKRTVAALMAEAPGLDWAAYLDASGIKVDDMIVHQPSAFKGIAALVAKTDISVLKDALTVRTLDNYADYLPKAFVDENFAFYGTTLSGTPENEPRWKRGVGFVTGVLGEELGKEYVERHFPPETKKAADDLVKNVIAAMDNRLQNLAWMTDETKAKAREKLASFTPKIGYPDKWRDYSDLEIKTDDLVGNAMRAARNEHAYHTGKLGGPINRDEWFMTPMTVNAYANPVMNEIVFPAAILQPPFFDPNADAAYNYGGIGAVIGHEISHHFDDQGRKYDKNGALKTWWTDEDIKQFDALTANLVAQYDEYEPLPGKKVQGKLTLGENIADLAGLIVAYDAYRMSLGDKEAAELEGYSGDQRFYLGWAQVWRRNYREENLQQRLLTDPHSPSIQRVWVVRNLNPWYAAFEAKEGSKMFLKEADRVKIW